MLYASKLAKRTLGSRIVDIDTDCDQMHRQLADLAGKTAPSQLALHGFGVHTAAALLLAAGNNAE